VHLQPRLRATPSVSTSMTYLTGFSSASSALSVNHFSTDKSAAMAIRIAESRHSSALAVALVSGFVIGVVPSAHAADICDAVALRDLAALEDPSSVLKRGEHDGAVSQYRINKKTGEASMCSHGGYCYPATITENGKRGQDVASD
jgi:hypothetical protein